MIGSSLLTYLNHDLIKSEQIWINFDEVNLGKNLNRLKIEMKLKPITTIFKLYLDVCPNSLCQNFIQILS